MLLAELHTSAASRLNFRPRRVTWPVRFAVRRNLVSARVPPNLNCTLLSRGSEDNCLAIVGIPAKFTIFNFIRDVPASIVTGAGSFWIPCRKFASWQGFLCNITITQGCGVGTQNSDADSSIFKTYDSDYNSFIKAQYALITVNL
jgi:hypothetical protein